MQYLIFMKKPLFFGLLGSLGLIAFYFFVMTLLSSPREATLQFYYLSPWIISISVGFGIQVVLYTKLRMIIKNANPGVGKGIIFASGTTSSVSMIACCAHHLVDVLPLIGFSALSIFLVRYQVPLLSMSLLINLLGITVMLRNLRKIQLSGNTEEEKKRGDYQ